MYPCFVYSCNPSYTGAHCESKVPTRPSHLTTEKIPETSTNATLRSPQSNSEDGELGTGLKAFIGILVILVIAAVVVGLLYYKKKR